MMGVAGMVAPIHSLKLIKGGVYVVATFGPGKVATVTPDDHITLCGEDGKVVHVTESTVTQDVCMFAGDTLEMTIRMNPESIMKVQRWVCI